MIDTDKYEEIMKHDWLFDEQLFVGGGKWRFALTEYTDLVDMPKKDIEEWEEGLEPVWEALVDFIADAPRLLADYKQLREALVKMMRYPESPYCETSQRMRPIPDDCNCAYCGAREALGWEVCPVCEYVSDIGSDDKHYEDSECWEESE